MEGSDPFERLARAGLERLGLVADDAELVVMRGADAIYGPQIQALMEVDLREVPAEPQPDLSRPPGPA